jgi:hypothetical protein
MNSPPDSIPTYSIVWRGITIAITYEANWLNLAGTVGTCAHLEIRSEGKRPLPITDTGYLSHFAAPADVDAMGGAAAYVQVWLDTAAQSGAPESPNQQLELF